MNDIFFEALLAIIIIPYGFIFLMTLWSEVGPSIRMRWKTEAE